MEDDGHSPGDRSHRGLDKEEHRSGQDRENRQPPIRFSNGAGLGLGLFLPSSSLGRETGPFCKVIQSPGPFRWFGQG